MLRVNVGVSRKLTKDYNSTGYSLNLEGEVAATLDDPEAMIERIKEIYDLAEEALALQIDRSQSNDAIASRDADNARPEREPTRNGNETRSNRASYANGNGNGNGSGGNGAKTNGDAATNKQIQYLLNIGKRQGLSQNRLEGRLAEILGQRIGLYDLTKRQAGAAIDAFTQGGDDKGRNGNGRN